MIANKFAADHYEEQNESNTHLQLSSRPPSGSNLKKSPRAMEDFPRDILANRVSFYMDDALASSGEDWNDSSALDLRQHQNYLLKKKLNHQHGPKSFITRERSFRVSHERKPVKRHASDVSPCRRQQAPCRLQRKRSGGSSRRQPASCRHGGSSSQCELARSSSLRSSSRSRRLQEAPGGRRDDIPKGNSIQLPHKELPPKERRRRIVVLIVIATFLFLVACSVLAVIVTLTHSSFHRSDTPPNPHANLSDIRK